MQAFNSRSIPCTIADVLAWPASFYDEAVTMVTEDIRAEQQRMSRRR